MQSTQNIDKNIQKKMQEELDKYLAHKENSKNYFVHVKEIAIWLQSKAK